MYILPCLTPHTLHGQVLKGFLALSPHHIHHTRQHMEQAKVHLK